MSSPRIPAAPRSGFTASISKLAVRRVKGARSYSDDGLNETMKILMDEKELHKKNTVYLVIFQYRHPYISRVYLTRRA